MALIESLLAVVNVKLLSNSTHGGMIITMHIGLKSGIVTGANMSSQKNNTQMYINISFGGKNKKNMKGENGVTATTTLFLTQTPGRILEHCRTSHLEISLSMALNCSSSPPFRQFRRHALIH